MSVWIWSAQTAVLWGSVAFLAIFLPVVAWQYRRMGDWNLHRLAGTAALTLYAVALITYTWLPLPPRTREWCDAHPIRPSFEPFHMVGDIARAAARSTTPLEALTNGVVLQVVFNVLLFVPLGMVMRRYFHRGIALSTAVGLVVSAFIEVTQLTGLWFLYPCAYRMFDIDDIILNTAGALVGALVAPLLLGWMPNARLLAATRLEPRPVTALRRWTGQAIDVFLVVALSTACTIGLAVLRSLLGFEPVAPEWQQVLIGVILPWVVVFVLPPWWNLAASPGQSAVWLTPVWVRDGVDTHGTLALRLLRANVSALPWVVLSLAELAVPLGRVPNLLWMAFVLVSVAMVPFTRTHGSLSCLLTGAEMRDIRTLAHADAGARPTAAAGRVAGR